MAKTINLIRNTNAKLIAKDVDFFGKRWAIQDRVDGYSLIDVTVKDTTESVKIYLEGDDSITTFAVPKNIDKLCAYALASFPNIENLYLFKQDGLVVLEDTLSYLQDLEHIYVPSAYLSSYISTYASMTVIHSGYDQFTTTSDYIGYYVYYGDTSVKVTADNKDDLNITAGTTIAYDKAPFSNIFEGDTYIIKHTEGEDELTIEEVELQHSMLDSTKVITKVIVPVEFTSYESGSIAKIQELFTNMTHLVTTYEAGAMTIDFQDSMWQDVLSKITSLNKTLDEALVYARYIAYRKSDTSSNAISNDGNLIILPPYIINIFSFQPAITNCSNLVYVSKLIENRSSISVSIVQRCSDLIEINYINNTKMKYTGTEDFIAGADYCKKYNLTFPQGTDETSNKITIYTSKWDYFSNGADILANGITSQLYLAGNYSSIMTRQQLVNLINSLGTPNIQKYLSLTTTGVNKLTNADIQLAYDKNWQLSPTPSAFSFDIGSDTYSCDFGMTWEQWVVSDKNTDSYSQFAGYVVDSNGNYVKLNGENVSINSMIRYGDIFDYEAYFGSFEYQGTLPTTPSPTSAKYYSDSACTNEVLVANLVIGTTYYYTLSFDYGNNFATDTWEQIKFAYDNGLANYSLGDTKSVTYDNNTYTIRICDIGARYDLSSGIGKNKATFEFVELVGSGRMNATNTNNGGFALSEMKTTTLPNIYNNLPSDLKSVISQVSVASASDGSASGSGSLSYSNNHLFLPSAYEIFGLRSNSNEIEQTSQYGWYASHNSASYRTKSPIGGSATYWWLRSTYAGNSSYFVFVYSVGNAGGGNASLSGGVGPFFCI